MDQEPKRVRLEPLGEDEADYLSSLEAAKLHVRHLLIVHNAERSLRLYPDENASVESDTPGRDTDLHIQGLDRKEDGAYTLVSPTGIRILCRHPAVWGPILMRLESIQLSVERKDEENSDSDEGIGSTLARIFNDEVDLPHLRRIRITAEKKDGKREKSPGIIESLSKIKEICRVQNIEIVGLDSQARGIKGLEAFQDLQRLFLEHLGETRIPDDIFAYATQLQDVSFRRNQLGDIPDGLHFCQGLTRLDVAFNNLASSPLWIGNYANAAGLVSIIERLRWLDISGNGFNTLPVVVTQGRRPNLRTLVVSNNMMTQLPDPMFMSLTNIESLNLSCNKITALPDNFTKLNNLKELDVSQNPIQTPLSLLAKCNTIRVLKADQNNVSMLPRCPPNIESVSLVGNAISQLPKGFFNYHNLRSLHISSNTISVIPPDIGSLPTCTNITVLSITLNRFSVFPKSVLSFRNLQSFSFSLDPRIFRRIEREREEKIMRAKQMRLLLQPHMGQNPMFFIHGFQQNQPKPKEQTRIPPIPLRLITRSLPALHRLSLNLCDFRTLRVDELSHLQSLEILDLSNNRISHIPDSIGVGFSHLRILNLSRNEVRSLPEDEMVRYMRGLRVVDLSYNHLVAMPEKLNRFLGVGLITHNNSFLSAEAKLLGNELKWTNYSCSSRNYPALPDGLSKFTNLTSIQASDNFISALPDSISSLSKIAHVDLSFNRFTRFPPQIFGWSHLVGLNLNSNEILLMDDIFA